MGKIWLLETARSGRICAKSGRCARNDPADITGGVPGLLDEVLPPCNTASLCFCLFLVVQSKDSVLYPISRTHACRRRARSRLFLRRYAVKFGGCLGRD